MKKRGFLKQKYVLVACVAGLISLCVLSVNIFILSVQKNETEIAAKNLMVTSNNGAAMVRSTFAGYMAQLRSLAKSIEQYDDFTSSEVMELLKQVAELNGYERLAINFESGKSYTSDGLVLDINDFTGTDIIVRDKEVIGDVYEADDGKNVVNFIVPLNKNGETTASLRLVMRTSALTDAINLTPFDTEGYYHLVDVNGNYVADVKSQNALLMDQNFFDAIDELNYDKGYSASQIRECFTRGASTFSKYSSNGQTRYSYCQPVGINKWVLMTIVPKDVISRSERQNISLAVGMTIQLALILTAAFVYIYIVQRKARKMAQLNDKCFRALSEQTGKVILEWNFAESRLTATKNFKELFGREIFTQSSHLDALDSKMVHPDDASVFTAVFTDIFHGVNFENVKFRIMHADGTYHWCLLAGVVVCDWKGKPYRAIGSLEDINEVVMRQEALKHKSEIDLLTGLYNKATTEYMINCVLSGGDGKAGNCALMIADIDNFKNVNDTFGHQTGDKVLKQVSDMIVPLVRKTDIVGRLGGDEFFIFFRNFDSEAAIRKKAEDICRMFKEQRTHDELESGISLSIGISFFPRDAHSFDELYKQADIALYRTKRSGKNGYIVYNPSFGTQISEKRTVIESSKEI